MDTKVLEYILAIAEEKSIQRAADRYFISHTALSKHLKKIEDDLGTPLFRRTGGSLQPTRSGLIFIGDARAVLHREQQLNQSLSIIRQQKKRMIRTMVSASFYNRFIKLVKPRFAEKHPGFELDVVKCSTSQATNALQAGRATLSVFFSSSPRSSELTYLPFHPTDIRFVFPPEYNGPTDLQGFRALLSSGVFCMLHPSGTSLRTIIDQQLAAHNIYPEHIMEGDSKSCLSSVAAGGTCTIQPRSVCVPGNPPQWIVGDALCDIYNIVAYSSNKALSAEVQELMQIIIDVFR